MAANHFSRAAASILIQELEGHIRALKRIRDEKLPTKIDEALRDIEDHMPSGGNYAGCLVVGDVDAWRRVRNALKPECSKCYGTEDGHEINGLCPPCNREDIVSRGSCPDCGKSLVEYPGHVVGGNLCL